MLDKTPFFHWKRGTAQTPEEISLGPSVATVIIVLLLLMFGPRLPLDDLRSGKLLSDLVKSAFNITLAK